MPGKVRGRPRNEEGRVAILAATRDLLFEVGYEQLRMSDLAARAGVGKQTIYRWWPSKAAVVAECVLRGGIDLAPLVIGRSGDLAADLRDWLDASHRLVSERQIAPLLRGLLAASLTEPTVARGLQEQFTGPLRDAIVASLDAAVRAGTASPDASPDALADLLMGLFVYFLSRDDIDSISRTARHIVDIVVNGAGVHRSHVGATPV